MIENVEAGERHDNFKAVQGIGLYKIRYEMDVENSSKRDNAYVAGLIAYTSEEAVQTLVNFAKKNVKGFKGLKIEEVSFDGLCHAMSDSVRDAVLKSSKAEGGIMSKEDHETALKEATKDLKKEIKELKKSGKKSILGDVKE